MTNIAKAGSERRDVEALLPWYAAGTPTRRDAARVEAVLSGDAELARHYDTVREELAETIHLNESLGAPTARAGDRLVAAIAAEGSQASQSRPALALRQRLGNWLASFSPRTLPWSGPTP